MSFPRQQSEWANIWGLEWHFCNSAAHNGSFANMSGKGERTTKIRSAWKEELLLHLQPLFKTSFSLSKLPWRYPLRFFTFLPHFYHFYSHLIALIEGFTFWIRFLHWAAHFVISLTWNNTHSWGFLCLYITTPFYISLKPWNLFFFS